MRQCPGCHASKYYQCITSFVSSETHWAPYIFQNINAVQQLSKMCVGGAEILLIQGRSLSTVKQSCLNSDAKMMCSSWTLLHRGHLIAERYTPTNPDAIAIAYLHHAAAWQAVAKVQRLVAKHIVKKGKLTTQWQYWWKSSTATQRAYTESVCICTSIGAVITALVHVLCFTALL